MHPRTWAPQHEKPPQGEACTQQLEKRSSSNKGPAQPNINENRHLIVAGPLYQDRNHDNSAECTTFLQKRHSSSGNLCILSFRSFRTKALGQQPLSQGWDNWSDGEGSAGAPCLSSLSVRLSLLLSLCSLRASPAQRDLFMASLQVAGLLTWQLPKEQKHL